MKKKTYFLILSFIILCLATNSSLAYSTQLDESSDDNQENMLINETNKNSINIQINDTNINISNKINKTTNEKNIENKILTKTDKIRTINANNQSNPINKLSSTIKTKTSIKTINESQFYRNNFIEVELVDSYNKRITNSTIYMTLIYENTSKIYKLTTNKYGIIKVVINLTKTYTVNFEFKGDINYLASNSGNITVIKDLSLNTILIESANLKKLIELNGTVPKTVKLNKTTHNTEEFLYIMCKAISNINKKSTTNIKIKYMDKAPTPVTKALTGKITKDEITKITNNILNFMNTNLRAPNYVSSSLGNIPYCEVIHMYSKILNFYKTEKRLCNYVTLEKMSSFKTNTITYNISYSVLNDKYKNETLSQYLKSTINCQSNNSQIINLAKSLTSTITNTYLKATEIYNYVRDKIVYSNYNNTKKGAINTLLQKSGNCVDQTHLLIAIARAAGIPSRYIHGTNCKFTSGLKCGHVWAQLLIGDTWVVADTTSSKNSLGIVKNWDINSYTLLRKSNYLSF